MVFVQCYSVYTLEKGLGGVLNEEFVLVVSSDIVELNCTLCEFVLKLG